MKIIINTSNLRWGGGIQVAISLFYELNKLDSNLEYHLFVSPAVLKELNHIQLNSNFFYYLIERSPASLKNRFKIKKKLSELENKIKPDVVLTLFGPAYWSPKAFHIEGFALGWITNPDSIAYSKLNFWERFKKRVENEYKTFYLKKEADHFVVETSDVKNKLSNVLKIDLNKITVIGNTYNSFFDKSPYASIKIPQKKDNTFRLVTISHFYVHKNLEIIKEIIPLLENSKLNYEFLLTIDEKNFIKHFKDLGDKIINLGPIDSKYCPYIYKNANALFLPTLLESFTSSYPEAMRMRLPILTSDLSFAKDICGDAAFYFDPLNPRDIANKIMLLAENEHLQNDLIRKGQERLKTFETARSRAEKYIQLFKKNSSKP